MFHYIITILVIILIHEFGHAYVAFLLGYKIDEVLLLPFGGITKIDKKINTPLKDEIKIAWAGVLSQSIILLLTFVLFKINIINEKYYIVFKTYNILIIIFNLIPIVPLDGYIIIKSMLEKVFNIKTSFIISNVLSLLLLLLFLGLNYLKGLNNYIIISFLMYKVVLEVKDYNKTYNKFVLERYLYDFNFKKIKVVKKMNAFFKDCYHILVLDNKRIDEKHFLTKMFDKE